MRFKVSDQIRSIKPYVAGKPIDELKRELQISHVIKLASNENPLGFSPYVYRAVISMLNDMNRYPDSSGYLLTQKIAQKYQVNPSNVVIGNGSDDLIALLSTAFLEQDDEAVMPYPTFLMYEITVKASKAKPVMVPLQDFGINLDSLLENITAKTKIVFITNPFNPTGSFISKDAFNDFMKKVPDNVLVIVDEAYIEFSRDQSIFNSLAAPLTDPRIISLRTFSKAYGLAGFRVGYGIMDNEISDIIQRIRQPFNVNSLGQAAACAAIEDLDFLQRSIDCVHTGIDFLTAGLKNLGLDVLPTESNFLMVNVKTDATRIFKKMLSLGVIVRSMQSYGFDTFLRINAGTRAENIECLKALETVLAEG